jgi:hypothetical protein
MSGRRTPSTVIPKDFQTMPEIYDPAGVDLTRGHSTPQFKLGTVANGEQSQKYMYVRASGTHVLADLVVIDEDFTSRRGNTTGAKLANMGPGWPQITIAQDYYYWCAVAGTGILGRMKDGLAADAQLFTSNSLGIMGTVNSAGAPVMLAGVRNVGLSSGAGGAYEIAAINPHFVVVETME